jgi:hypothetical protein
MTLKLAANCVRGMTGVMLVSSRFPYGFVAGPEPETRGRKP